MSPPLKDLEDCALESELSAIQELVLISDVHRGGRETPLHLIVLIFLPATAGADVEIVVQHHSFLVFCRNSPFVQRTLK